MQTLILSVQYDGTNYAGWQNQNNAVSVQEVLEKAIEKVTGKFYPVIASGRTDSGVHARNQIVSVIIDKDFRLPENKIVFAVNSKLPFDISINFSKIYEGKFNARFDAVLREYEYFLSVKYDVFERKFVSYIKYPLDKSLLFDSAEIFKRKIDYTSYSKLNPDNNNPVCNVTECRWEEISPYKYKLVIKSNHFLYGMVRSIVGVMLDIARRKISKETALENLLKKDRIYNSPLAPPQGLYLNKVYYPDKFGIEYNTSI